jgi:hypothetical protein
MKQVNRPMIIALVILTLVLPASQAAAVVIIKEFTAQGFLDTYCGGTIPSGLTVSITGGTTGEFVGDCSIVMNGQIQPDHQVTLKVSGVFTLKSDTPESGQIQLGEHNSVSAGAIRWQLGGSVQVKMNSLLHAQTGDVIIDAGADIQLEENLELKASKGAIKIQSGGDGSIQIKVVDKLLTAPNISAGTDIIILTAGDIQIQDGNRLEARTGSIEFRGTGEFSDFQIGKAETNLPFPSLKASKNISLKTNGDIQVQDGNWLEAVSGMIELTAHDGSDIQIQTVSPPLPVPNIRAGTDIILIADGDIQVFDGNSIAAGGMLKLQANDAGDIQFLKEIAVPPVSLHTDSRLDPAAAAANMMERAPHLQQHVLPFPRIDVGSLSFEAEGDINFQKDFSDFPKDHPPSTDQDGKIQCNQTFYDIKVREKLFMRADGEVEIEPGNWLCANMIELWTSGVEVQVQPRADVTLEAETDIWLKGPEENAGITVGEYANLRANNNITLQSGEKDQGEGDTRVKENATLTAGNSIFIQSGVNGQSEVKEQNMLTAGNKIIIESAFSGQTIVKGAGTTLLSNIVVITTGQEGECIVQSDVLIQATIQDICVNNVQLTEVHVPLVLAPSTR